MGLDTSHDCWHGPYSSFSQWRTALAKAEGLPTEQGRWDNEIYSMPEGDWQPRNYQGWWDEDPADPLYVLLVHSDCDGYIFPDQAGPLADRLEKIVTGDEYNNGLTLQFVAGLRYAAEEWEVITFH